MIYVTQGHEKSISLEVFIKSFIMLSKKKHPLFKLVVNKNLLVENLQHLKVPFLIQDDHVMIANNKLNCHFIETSFKYYSYSTLSLLTALDQMSYKEDILITMPTSKDQLVLDGVTTPGYTEFFRRTFSKNTISMVFSSFTEHLLLITDHIPLNQVSSEITPDLIHNKTIVTLKSFSKYFHPLDEVFLSGINPHAGENNLLGSEDSKIKKVVHNLKQVLKNIKFEGPLPGDTIFLKNDHKKNQLFVFMYHDQALSWFKGKNQFLGANITLGLPFLRMSVDHGTAFELYGKNQANYLGCFFLLKKALKAQEKILLKGKHESKQNKSIQSSST